MAAGRHNLSRRAVLGVGVGACVALPGARDAGGARAAGPAGAGPRQGRPGAGPGPGETLSIAAEAGRRRWERALAAFERATARLAAFQAEVDRLPPHRRAFPACEPLEERFGDLECARLAALRRLLRAPAPDLPAFTLKLELLIDERAWELTGAEPCLAAIRFDARRLAGGR